MRITARRRPDRALAVLAGVTLLLAAACGDGGGGSSGAVGEPSEEPTPVASTVTPSTGTSSTSSPRLGETATATTAVLGEAAGPMYGIAGFVPPHFPDSTEDDWITLFAAVPSLGGTIGNYAPLADLAANQAVGVAAGLQVLPVTGFHHDLGGRLEVTVDFADPAQRAAFLHDLRTFVAAYEPRYLGVGNEVNRVWEQDRAAFEGWLAALPEIRDAVREASPHTQVFATFQYEFLVGLDTITGEGREPDWTPVELASPHLDLVAFTSYPYFGFEDPEHIPSDYYAAIRAHTDRPVGFTELGWPSGPIQPLEGSALAGLGGSPEEQEAFIRRLPELLAPVAPPFALWVWAYDTPAVGPTFESLGLSSHSGEAKPALRAWQEFAGG